MTTKGMTITSKCFNNCNEYYFLQKGKVIQLSEKNRGMVKTTLLKE